MVLKDRLKKLFTHLEAKTQVTGLPNRPGHRWDREKGSPVQTHPKLCSGQLLSVTTEKQVSAAWIEGNKRRRTSWFTIKMCLSEWPAQLD